MALYQPAVSRLLPENDTQPLMRATQVILHVAASEGDSLYNWWMHPGNNLESHFYIRYDGTVEQYIDTTRSADANYLANLRPDGTGAISIETEGLAEGWWTAAQLDSIQRLIDWAHEEHSVPLSVCRTPSDPGVGWHVMFGAPGAWTNVPGKVCPGPMRIDQFLNLIAARFGAEPEEFDMTPDELSAAVEKAFRAVLGGFSDQVAYGLLKALRHPEVVQRLTAIEKSDVVSEETPDGASS